MVVQKKNYDSKLFSHTYQVGDAVYERNLTPRKGVSRKLQPRLKGPYLVEEAGGVIYLVRSRKKRRWLHHNNLIPCNDRRLPLWLLRRRRQLVETELTTDVLNNTNLSDGNTTGTANDLLISSSPVTSGNPVNISSHTSTTGTVNISNSQPPVISKKSKNKNKSEYTGLLSNDVPHDLGLTDLFRSPAISAPTTRTRAGRTSRMPVWLQDALRDW